jgi:hypothetical protein
MGFLKDLWNTRKQMKALEQETFGTTSSVGLLKELVSEAPALVEQAGAAVGQLRTDQAEAERLQTAGIDAQATIMAVRDTGSTISIGRADNPIVELDLTVHRDGTAGTNATMRTVVPRLSVSRLVVGGTLAVKVDPLDASKVAVVWG